MAPAMIGMFFFGLDPIVLHRHTRANTSDRFTPWSRNVRSRLKSERINFEYPPAEPSWEQLPENHRARMELLPLLASRDQEDAVVEE